MFIAIEQHKSLAENQVHFGTTLKSSKSSYIPHKWGSLTFDAVLPFTFSSMHAFLQNATAGLARNIQSKDRKQSFIDERHFYTIYVHPVRAERCYQKRFDQPSVFFCWQYFGRGSYGLFFVLYFVASCQSCLFAF